MKPPLKVSKNRLYAIGTVIALFVVLMLFLLREPNGGAGVSVAINTLDDPAKGPAGANATIIVFSDFECSACRKFYIVMKNVDAEYGDSVRVVFKDFPILDIHPSSMAAAEAAECADEQGKFWDMHDSLYENQFALDMESLYQHAEFVGLDMDRFDTCMKSGIMAVEVRGDIKDGIAAGVSAIPTFFINGAKYVGVYDYAKVKGIVERALKTAK
ncbi:MAG: DsbA family protein [archaeon]